MKILLLPTMLLSYAVVYGQQTSAQQAKVPQTAVKSTTQQGVSKPSESTFASSSSESTDGTRTYSVNSKGEQIELNQAYYENRLLYLQNLITSIQIKIDYINSNSEEKSKAIENGWFEQMEGNIQRINAEIQSVKEKLATY